MTNSLSDQRFNMWHHGRKMGFIPRIQSHSFIFFPFSLSKRGSALPAAPPGCDAVKLLCAEPTGHVAYKSGCARTGGVPQQEHTHCGSSTKRKKEKNKIKAGAHHCRMWATRSGFFWRLLLFSCVFLESLSQDFVGQTQFICTSVPKDVDICAATLQNSVPGEDLKTTVMQLRETVLQQKETIINQKETIRELTSKLARCESQSGGVEPGDARPGGRRKEAGTKNTMGDVSRGPAETLTQLSQTLQSLKQRLENLEVG